MAYSEITYSAFGGVKDFAVNFDYLDESHVLVEVDDVLTTATGSNYTAELIGSTTMRVTTTVDGDPPPAGAKVRIFRTTPIDQPAVVFGAGASLSSDNLNKNAQYLTYALQEATDENLLFTSKYLGAKLAAPTKDNSGDPLVKGASYFDLTDDSLHFWNGTEWKKGDLLEDSIAARDAAQGYANLSANYSSAASNSASDAATSASAASTSETNAKSSENAASSSAGNSASSATTSQNWAESTTAPGGSGTKSSKTHAAEASTSASNASSSASAASTSETNAASSASTATTKASEASSSATSASNSATSASDSASLANTYKNNAATSASAASTSETNAEAWADNNEDVEVVTGKFSAKHWAAKAEADAATAQPGAYVHLVTSSGDGASSIDFTDLDLNLYHGFMFLFRNIQVGTQGANLLARYMDADEPGVWQSGASDYRWTRNVVNSIQTQNHDYGDSSIQIAGGLNDGAGQGISGTYTIAGHNGFRWTQSTWMMTYNSQGQEITQVNGGAVRPTGPDTIGVRFFPSTGTFSGVGTLSLYGIRNS